MTVSKSSVIGKRKTWFDLVHEFPHMWVMFDDIEYVKDDRGFICTVRAICTDEERNNTKDKLRESGYRCTALRTTDAEWGGVYNL